jgi:hypothetical protein
MPRCRSCTREFELTYPEPRTVRLYMVPFRSDGRGGRRRFAVILSDITATSRPPRRASRTSAPRPSCCSPPASPRAGQPAQLAHHPPPAHRAETAQAQGGKETDSLTDSIHVCQDEVKRLDGIITNFLDAIRPRPPDLAEVNLADVLSEVLAFQQRELADRDIHVEAETAADLPTVMADRNQVKQVFFNLLKNAVEAMQPGGRLRDPRRGGRRHVVLAFGDSGSGIKQDDLLRLFQPYHTTKTGRPRPRPHDRAAHHARTRRPDRHREQGGRRHHRDAPVPPEGPPRAHAAGDVAPIVLVILLLIVLPIVKPGRTRTNLGGSPRHQSPGKAARPWRGPRACAGGTSART